MGWNKVQAHKDESDKKEKKPEGKGKDTKERKPKGKANDKKEEKKKNLKEKEKKQKKENLKEKEKKKNLKETTKKKKRERKPLGKDKKQRRERREGKGKGKGKGKDTKERKPEKEDHIAFDDIKEQFSKIFEKLSAVKKEAKQLFSKKDISEDEQTKGLEYIGGKIEDFSQNMREIHHHFEDLKNSGKLNKEEVDNTIKNFEEVNEFFGQIYAMGDEQNQKIDHKKHEKEEKSQKNWTPKDAEPFEEEEFQGKNSTEIDAEHFEEEEFQGKNSTETIIPAKKFAKKFNQMKMNPRAWGQSGPKNTEDIEEEEYQEKNATKTIIPKKFNQMKM